MTKPKLYRKRAWAVLGASSNDLYRTFDTRQEAVGSVREQNCVGLFRIIPVTISEIPAKSKGRRP